MYTHCIALLKRGTYSTAIMAIINGIEFSFGDQSISTTLFSRFYDYKKSQIETILLN